MQSRRHSLATAWDATLIRALIATPMPSLYNEYITLLQRVSHNLESIAKSAIQEHHTTTTTTMQQSHTDGMDWEPTGHASVAATGAEGKRRACWATEKELADRCTRKDCLRCGGSDHFVAGCELLPTVRPRATNVPVAGSVEKVMEEDEDSGKE